MNNDNNLSSRGNRLEYPLKTFLKQYDRREIGSLLLKPIYMGRNSEIIDDPINPSLMIDYVWRFNQSYGDLPWQRYKQIYNPNKAWYIGIHYCWVCKGKKEVRVEPNVDSGLILFHYKTPHKGTFRVTSAQIKMQDTTIRDMYRDDLVNAMAKVEHDEQ
jgi:hypothetical protein